MTVRNEFRKGQYSICRHRGTGGDLISGRIELVRHPRTTRDGTEIEGRVISKKLWLTDDAPRSNKEMGVFRRKNIICTRKQALHVAEVMKTQGKHAAKEVAKKYVAALEGVPAMPPASPPALPVDKKVKKVIGTWKAMSPAQRASVMTGIFNTIAAEAIAAKALAAQQRRGRRM